MNSNTDKVKIITFSYTNHRGETGTRRVRPLTLYFGQEEPYYPEPQWLLEAWDFDREALRTFAMAKITEWRAAALDAHAERG